MKVIKAYKAFYKDFNCRGFQFEIGKEYTHEKKLVMGKSGFHACILPIDCFTYYPFDKKKTRMAEVELSGNMLYSRYDTEICASKIKIVKELSWNKVFKFVNTGVDNKGIYNSGHCNIGEYNSGNFNKGKNNSGYYNKGQYNSGSNNIGDYNSFIFNIGNFNSGGYNIGNKNSGSYNIGNENSGHDNIGNYNSGCYNIGNYNTGNFNIGNRHTGSFNTVESVMLSVFNKEITIKEYNKIYFPEFLTFCSIELIAAEQATKKERRKFSHLIKMNDYLWRRLEYKEAFKKSWKKADKYDRERIKDIPGFDSDIFYEISGIMVD